MVWNLEKWLKNCSKIIAKKVIFDIAYKNEKGMYTGKVMSVYENEVVIQTVNKSIYTIDKQDITWIKLGSRWPTGIHNALIASKAGTNNG